MNKDNRELKIDAVHLPPNPPAIIATVTLKDNKDNKDNDPQSMSYTKIILGTTATIDEANKNATIINRSENIDIIS